jgi:hypothetical protein
MTSRTFRRAVLLAVAGVATVASADVMKVVPDDAVAVIRINSLQRLDERMGKFFTDLGVTALQPELASPLTNAKAEAGVTKGINDAGDAAMVFRYIEGAASEESFFLLIPVSDFDAFVSNFDDPANDADNPVVEDGVTVVTMNSGERGYLKSWGDHVAMGPTATLVASVPETTLKLDDAAAAQLGAYDLSILALPEKARDDLADALADLKDQVGAEADAMVGLPVDPAVVSVMIEQFVGIADTFVRDAKHGMVGVNFNPAGVNVDVIGTFAEGSYLGNLAGSLGGTEEPLLTGLPADNYVMYAGGRVAPDVLVKLFDDLLAPVAKALEEADGPGIPGLTPETLASSRQQIASLKSFAIAWISPASMPDGALNESIGFMEMDGAGIRTSMKLMAEAITRLAEEAKAAQDAGEPTAPGMMLQTATFEENVKTVAGVSFDRYTQKPLPSNDPMVQQQMQMMGMLGISEQVMYIGQIEGGVIFMSGKVDDATATTLIEAAKARKAPMADVDVVKATAGNLPTQRLAEVYFQSDELIATAVKLAGKFGFMINAQTPTGLEPIGTIVSADGSNIRVSQFIPTRTIQANVSSVLQIVQEVQKMFGGGQPQQQME